MILRVVSNCRTQSKDAKHRKTSASCIFLPMMNAATPQKRKISSNPASPFNPRVSDYFTAKKKPRRLHCTKALADAPSDLRTPELPNAKKSVPIMDAASSPKRKKPTKMPASLRFDCFFPDLEDDFAASFGKSGLQKKYKLGNLIGEDTEGAVYKAIDQKVYFRRTKFCITYHSCIIFSCVLHRPKKRSPSSVWKKSTVQCQLGKQKHQFCNH